MAEIFFIGFSISLVLALVFLAAYMVYDLIREGATLPGITLAVILFLCFGLIVSVFFVMANG